MFEYLRCLNLPNFGFGNWHSGIRGYANAHPEYRGIQNVDSDAMTDIEYHDEAGVFTNFLIQRGYWLEQMRQLTYHFEVKATTNTSWNMPFYISDRQKSHASLTMLYRVGDRLTSWQIDSDMPAQGRIYVICRLYGIGQGAQTHLRIYLDPRQALRAGRLVLERGQDDGYNWKVTPTE
jgi:hypothetical protein